jgi:hypothetical protein
MLGDREAVVTEVKSFDLHGVTSFDLALIFSDGAHRAHGLVPRVCPTGSGQATGSWS